MIGPPTRQIPYLKNSHKTGTIQISVLEIRNLPSSSSPDSVSIRVTMGKREYQIAADKGDFSIPLTTLRENMLFKVFDANGIEISRTGIETKTVVEKGSWNDTFPLEGGGEMLLKLQFILSEEERNRIRMMRLSALKKRDSELIDKTLTLPEKAPTTSLSYDEGSGQLFDESVEQKKVGLTNKRALPQEEVVTSSSPHDASRVISRTDELARPNQDTTTESTDGSKDPRPSPLSAKISNPEPTSSSAPRELKEGVRDVQGPPGKTPSSIRTMISVFESGLAPVIQESQTSSKTFDGDSVSQESTEHVVSRTEGAVSDPQKVVNVSSLREETSREIEERFRPTTVLDDPDSSPSLGELATTPDSDGSYIRNKKSRARIAYSLDKMNWGDFYRDEEIPGIWIFPDDTRSLCITTGGKHAVRLMECCVESITASMTEHSEEGTMPREIERDVKEGKRAVQQANLSSSACGPSGQAMRIAVMVGFGVLVLFTRRRKDR